MPDADDESTVAAAPEPKPAPKPAPAAPAPDAKEAAIDRAVGAWLEEHIKDSPVSRYTPALNFLKASIGDLRARLLKEL